MDKKRLKVALVVLDAVKSRFPEIQEFILEELTWRISWKIYFHSNSLANSLIIKW